MSKRASKQESGFFSTYVPITGCFKPHGQGGEKKVEMREVQGKGYRDIGKRRRRRMVKGVMAGRLERQKIMCEN